MSREGREVCEENYPPQNPNGIQSFSPALARSGYAGSAIK